MSISIAGIERTVDTQLTAYDCVQQVNSTAQTTSVEQTEKTSANGPGNVVKVLNKYDRVEISAAAYQYASNALSTFADAETQAAANDTPKLIDTSALTQVDDDNPDLTTLSESELRSLVSEGTITQAQADTELLRRANERPKLHR